MAWSGSGDVLAAYQHHSFNTTIMGQVFVKEVTVGYNGHLWDINILEEIWGTPNDSYYH